MIKTVFILIHVIVNVTIMLPIGIVAMLLSFLGMSRIMSAVIYRIAQIWSLQLLKLIGCTVTVTGRENIPMSGGACFVSNHGSIFDIVLLAAYCGRPIGFIAKKGLVLIPVLNVWIFLLGGLFIDRKNIRKARNTINKGIDRIKAGGGMVIFPEGRRSRGQGLLPFHPGSLKLATQAQAPIVPVAISGSYDLFEKNMRIRPVPVKVNFCKPIYTEEIPPEDRKIVLCDRVYAVIKEQLDS